MDEHTRWNEEHRKTCQDCYEGWLDACQDMADDARLDALIEVEENNQEGEQL